MDGHTINKVELRRSFARMATSYDAAAGLVREVADRMLERLDLLKATPECVLDLGSGTGYCARQLRRRYPKCTVVELDFALSMLLHARTRGSWWRRGLNALRPASTWQVCADMEHLPFAAGHFDMVWSNMALLWASDPAHAFAEAWRVLRPGGVCMFSTLGPDTLKELRAAYARADQRVHVNRFLDMHDLGDILVGSRFADPVMDMECITATYSDLRALLKEIKATGAGNANAGKNMALSGKHAFGSCLATYERLRAGGRLPATFEVVYGQAWKAQRGTPRTDGRAVITFHDSAAAKHR